MPIISLHELYQRFRDVGGGQVVQVGAAGVSAGGLFGGVELGTEFRGDPRELLGVDGAVGELVGGKV